MTAPSPTCTLSGSSPLNPSTAWSCSCPSGAPIRAPGGGYATALAEAGGEGLSSAWVLACPAGSFCEGGTKQPVQCPVGKMCPRGAAGPQSCGGRLCLSLGTSVPAICPPGSYCSPTWIPPADAASLSAESLRALAALPCPGGSFCVRNSPAPTSCPAGFICPPGSASALACPDGTFAAFMGQEEGTPCPRGTFSQEPDPRYGRQSCTGRCANAAWLWKSGQGKCVLSDGAVALIIICIALPLLVIIAVCIRRWYMLRAAKRRAASVRAAQEAERVEAERVASLRALESSRSSARMLCTSIGMVRRDLTTRLAADAMQVVLASPAQSFALSALQRLGVQRAAEERFLALLHGSIEAALVDAELQPDVRLLSLLALNPHRPGMRLEDAQISLRAAMAAQVLEGFGLFATQVHQAHVARFGERPAPNMAAADLVDPPCTGMLFDRLYHSARAAATLWTQGAAHLGFIFNRPPTVAQIEHLVGAQEWAVALGRGGGGGAGAGGGAPAGGNAGAQIPMQHHHQQQQAPSAPFAPAPAPAADQRYLAPSAPPPAYAPGAGAYALVAAAAAAAGAGALEIQPSPPSAPSAPAAAQAQGHAPAAARMKEQPPVWGDEEGSPSDLVASPSVAAAASASAPSAPVRIHFDEGEPGAEASSPPPPGGV